MKRYFVILFLISISLILNVEAIEPLNNLKGCVKSRYTQSIFSHNRVEIDNISSDGNYIKGSKFQIMDINNNIVYEWENFEETYVIEGLNQGKYYLIQNSIPDGYELNQEKIEFEVMDDIVTVEFINPVEVFVPGTMSSFSILLIFVGMFDIALGIGIIVYVKRNKV